MMTKDNAKRLAMQALEKRLNETSRLYKDACQAIQEGVDDGRLGTLVRLSEAQARDYKEDYVSEVHDVVALLDYLDYETKVDITPISAHIRIFWR